MLAVKQLILMFAIITMGQIMEIDTVCKLSGKVTDSNGDALIGANVMLSTTLATITDIDGEYSFDNLVQGKYTVVVSYTGYATSSKEITISDTKPNVFDIVLEEGRLLEEVVVVGYKVPLISVDNTSQGTTTKGKKNKKSKSKNEVANSNNNTNLYPIPAQIPSNESYAKIKENVFVNTLDEALSTFSLDVDRAAYSNVKRFINMGTIPPSDAIRIEEMINYFDYDYPAPNGDDILAVQTSLTDCPWNSKHQLLHLGVQSKKIDLKDLPLSNLVFLIDVSGSMGQDNKLPLVISSFKMLLNQLRPDDRVAIVTYAGAAGVALPSTKASNKAVILQSLEDLQAGGSTAGAQGIITAYEIAVENFIEGGNNRVVLATDGDFNVGISDNGSLETLIEKKRKTGVFLSVLGYGMGNYKDDKMQILADKGNGNHAYINDSDEARKVLVNEFGGTMYTLAKDVKFQLEFNPNVVQAYKLVGYENRMLNKEDFNDDTKDAGELGMGHQMTAVYEIVPTGQQMTSEYNVDPLKYQSKILHSAGDLFTEELATIKFRYKDPNGDQSRKWEQIVLNEHKDIQNVDEDIRFSVAVAFGGLMLRNNELFTDVHFEKMIDLARTSKSKDSEGYKSEFVRLMNTTNEILKNGISAK